MKIPNFNLKELIECGVHFGHKTQKWNPKMEQYIHSIRENVHIIDLTQTMVMLSSALDVIQKTVAKGGKILFVATKKQASLQIAELAIANSAICSEACFLVATNRILPPFATVFCITSKADDNITIVCVRSIICTFSRIL